MDLPFTLTPGFTQAVDSLMQDPTVPDSTLHARSKRYLEVFDDTTAGQVSVQPAWSERIRTSSGSPLRHPFTTPGLFTAMFQVADELVLVAGKRYVSAAICVCGEHAARAHSAAAPLAGAEMHGALVRALHELSSTWAAFLLWPFHAYGNDDRFDPNDDDRWPASAGDETPTAASIARAQRHHLRELVMARDNQRCFLSGGLDSSAYHEGMPDETRIAYCATVPIIPAELLPSESEPNQDVMWGILRRFCGIQDAATLAPQVVHGPANTLLVHGWAAKAFHQFLWWLLPTETPDRYEIKNPNPVFNIGQGQPLPSHVTFTDHSLSARARAPGSASAGVDLPDRTLLRVHAALAEVLHRSGAINTFWFLQQEFLSHPRSHRSMAWSGSGCSYSYSTSAGGAFWRSVVEYEGPEMCAEVELREAVQAMALGNSAGAVSHAVQ